MKCLLAGISGFLLGAAVFEVIYFEKQFELSSSISRAQGKIDVMELVCRPALEKVGLISKEKDDAK